MRPCRLCGHQDLVSVLDLGEQRPSGHFPGPGDPLRPRMPLHVLACPNCHLAQLFHEIPATQQFTGLYGYRSGVNETMVAHLKNLAEQSVLVWNRRHIGPGARRPGYVLDIGCNDGTLLGNFQDAYIRIGIDPSPWLLECDSGIGRWKGFFPEICPTHFQFDLVFSVAMFYDLDDPLAAARAIRRIIAPGGLWVCEVADWTRMVREGIWDGICHEHLTYWTDMAMLRLADETGFELVGLQRSDCNGGSVRYYFYPVPAAESARAFITTPPQTEEYVQFAAHAAYSRAEIRRVVESYARHEGLVHLYGASTKANVVLQACDLGPDLIQAAAERSPVKIGRQTSTGIPIVDELDSRRSKPDAYLVGPWHFRQAILGRESVILHDGTDFIFPLPKVTIELGHVRRLKPRDLAELERMPYSVRLPGG